MGPGFEHIGVNKLALKTREGERHLNISWSAVQTERKEQYKINGFDRFECTIRRSDRGRLLTSSPRPPGKTPYYGQRMRQGRGSM